MAENVMDNTLKNKYMFNKINIREESGVTCAYTQKADAGEILLGYKEPEDKNISTNFLDANSPEIVGMIDVCQKERPDGAKALLLIKSCDALGENNVTEVPIMAYTVEIEDDLSEAGIEIPSIIEPEKLTTPTEEIAAEPVPKAHTDTRSNGGATIRRRKNPVVEEQTPEMS